MNVIGPADLDLVENLGSARCQVGDGLPVIRADCDVQVQAAGRGDKSLGAIRGS